MKIIVEFLTFFLFFALDAFSEKAVKIAYERNVLVTNNENGLCSGFIIETNLVLTAKHCVQATKVQVDGVEVEKVTQSKTVDVARLDVKTNRFKRIEFVKNIQLGDKVRMVANPGGHVGWSYFGEISYLAKDGIIHMTIIGAPGTSGAGVINEDGKFLGIHFGYYFLKQNEVEIAKISGMIFPYNSFQELLGGKNEASNSNPFDLPMVSPEFQRRQSSH